MTKALIINLNNEIDQLNENDKFINSARKQFDFLNIELIDIKDMSYIPELLGENLEPFFTEADIVITVGGLGIEPTDLVKKQISEQFGVPLVFHQKTFECLKEQYSYKLDKRLDDAACYPKGSLIFKGELNFGFSLEKEEKTLICLPHDELDLNEIFFGSVLNYISDKYEKNFITAEKEICFKDEEEVNKIALNAGSNICVSFYKSEKGFTLVTTGNQKDVDEFLSSDFSICQEEQPIFNIPCIEEPCQEKTLIEEEPVFTEKKNKKPWLIILFVIFVIVAIASGLYLFYNSYQEKQSIKNNQEVQQMMSLGEETEEESSLSEEISDEIIEESDELSESSEESMVLNENIPPKFRELYAKNEDIVGWIKIDGTNINYPVMQSDDNEYYLNKNFNRKDDKYGVPFADYRNDLENIGQNTVIYSHNVKDDQMFGELTGYRNLDFYKKHPVINFDTIYGEGKYKVIAGFITNTIPEHGEIFDYTERLTFENQNEFLDFAEELTDRSFINMPVDIMENDEILILSTCTYEFTAARFVVAARKIRAGEDESIDVSKAELNEEPIMPDVWYELFGRKKSSLDVKVEIPSSSEVSSETSSSSQESSEEREEVPAEIPETSLSSSQVEADIKNEFQDSSEEESKDNSSSKTSESSSSKAENHSNKTVIISSSNKRSYEEKSDLEDDEDATESGQIFNEKLKANINGKITKVNAYDLVCSIVENETRGNMHPEALKAQSVATYTYLKYSNQKGIYPVVSVKSSISSPVKKAVKAVLGETIKYKGQLINAVYHSTSCGNTAASKYVWGTNLPYLVSVESPWDEESPYYKNTYKISEEDFADRALSVYGIDLYEEGLDPEDWIYIDESCLDPGGYIGLIEIGGHRKSCGGKISKGTEINGRNFREKLMNFSLKSSCFDVEYRNGYFVFTTYGYGHGVGMSQWGAQGMAKEGYSYEEILEHYYTGAKVHK